MKMLYFHGDIEMNNFPLNPGNSYKSPSFILAQAHLNRSQGHHKELHCQWKKILGEVLNHISNITRLLREVCRDLVQFFWQSLLSVSKVSQTTLTCQMTCRFLVY